MRACLCLLYCLLPVLAATAAPVEDTWMRVMLDGRKIGSMHTTRFENGDRIITTQALDVELDRAGVKVSLTTSETDTETRDGKPISFESHTGISGIASTVTGKIRTDGKFDVTSDIGGAKQQRVMDWPQGALLAEGQRRLALRNGLTPGTRFSELAFQPETLDAVTIESAVGATEPVGLPDGVRALVKVQQNIHMPGAETASMTWVDAHQNVYKMMMSLMGYDLTMLACSRSCANAPNQSADILTHAMVAAPAALDASALQHGVVVRLSATSQGAPLQFAATDEQRVLTDPRGTELQIVPLGAQDQPHREDQPVAADTSANSWLQSDAPEIRKLAKEGVGDATSPHEQMQRLEQFVRSYIRTKDLNVGYASALEVARNPEGDCTEHAVLLAALGRAQGIPTRVVDGLAYTDHYAGMDHVFVPHAWAQAFVDGHWQSFDAALHGFDAGHIALAVGDGDPWRFFAGFDTLGRLRIEAIVAASAPAGAVSESH